MVNALPRRFVLAAPPTMLAAIGEALRRAFTRPELRSMRAYERLLDRLDRLR